MEIKYPTYKFQTNPTPSDTLWICDNCGHAHWDWYDHNSNAIWCYSCSAKNNNHRRKRRATEEEQEEGKNHLKKIL